MGKGKKEVKGERYKEEKRSLYTNKLINALVA
jgi:hypothetical protein